VNFQQVLFLAPVTVVWAVCICRPRTANINMLNKFSANR